MRQLFPYFSSSNLRSRFNQPDNCNLSTSLRPNEYNLVKVDWATQVLGAGFRKAARFCQAVAGSVLGRNKLAVTAGSRGTIWSNKYGVSALPYLPRG